MNTCFISTWNSSMLSLITDDVTIPFVITTVALAEDLHASFLLSPSHFTGPAKDKQVLVC